VTVKFPSTTEFLEAFGLEPREEDPSMASCRYSKASADGKHEIEFSFSAVTDSFQAILRYEGKELVTLSAEQVSSIQLRHDLPGSGVRVFFEQTGARSEAVVRLEPDLHCYWWSVRA
jgi:hypothetical protein